MSSFPQDEIPQTADVSAFDKSPDTSPEQGQNPPTSTAIPPHPANTDSSKRGGLRLDASPSPELESLSSSSEPEDQYYDAPDEEESTVTQKDQQEGRGTVELVDNDSKTCGSLEMVVEKTSDDVPVEHPVGSLEGEFIMVNYPTTMGGGSDTHKHKQETTKQETAQMELEPSSPLVDSDKDTSVDAQSVGVTTHSTSPQTDNNSQRPLQTVELGAGESAESAQTLTESSHEVKEEETVREAGEVEEGQAMADREEEESSLKEEGKGDVSVSAFESLGLLYARSPNLKHDKDLLKPADEVAEDVLETFDDIEADEVLESPLSPDEPGRGKQLGLGYSSSHKIDPGALFHMEKRAQTVATELSHVMDSLRNSLHAMTVCTRQSIELHRESVDNLHTIVDTNIKGMYTFMAKFEELNKSLGPLHQIASQIHDVDEKLKILEQAFRVNAPKGSSQSPVKVP